MNYPKKVVIGDITVRDGFQHEEKFIPTEAKLWLAEELVLCGFKHLEITNFGNPTGMPQFKDADILLKKIRTSKRIQDKLSDVSLTAVTIREKAVERAIQAKLDGFNQRIAPQKKFRSFFKRILENVRRMDSKS
jgi:hydroxymethylglutaryl-CoA lyase